MYLCGNFYGNSLLFVFLCLGFYGNLYLLTDHLLDLYRQSSAYRKQAAMVLNEMVRGSAGIARATRGQCLDGEVKGGSASQEDIKAVVVSIMEEYTSPANWHLITGSEESARDHHDQQVFISSSCFELNHFLTN